ncbi:MAG TPA: hypothetical protein VNL73_03675 [Verrucomicrobiae bacterium]|nr:hypothetical protein [Verrucomicrobiae bacterium]
MKQTLEGYIDEYNQLRAEIRMYLEHGTKSLQIAMVLSVAAMTFGHQYKFPWLLILSSLIVLYLWYDEIRHLRAVKRTAAYLEVFVEQKVPGLNWETYSADHPFDKSFVNRAIAAAPFPTLVVVQALYGFHLAGWPLWLGITGIAIFTGYFSRLSYLTAKYGREEERQHWEEVLRKRTSD